MHPKRPIPEAKFPKSKIAETISQKSFYSEKGDPNYRAILGSCAWPKKSLNLTPAKTDS
jgi:hypothetical protein